MPGSIAYLSTNSLEGFYVYDHLTHEPLRQLGWTVETVSWRASVDWSRFDAVVVRSTWDYQDSPADFLRVLEEIDARTRLFNGLDLIRWNLDKRYLGALGDRGVEIVPTRFLETADPTRIADCFDAFDSRELVLKPCVGANADGVTRLVREELHSIEAATRAVGAGPVMVQPFLEKVVAEGETSTFYFDGAFSHAILKTPAPSDFRVQEEHGGRLRAVPVDPALREASELVLSRLPEVPLYARLDFIRDERGRPLLIEAELIEPSLYFQLDEASPQRFARALTARL